MRVLHIITSLDAGGAQSMLRDLLRVWKGEAMDSHVAALTGGALVGEIAGLGVDLVDLRLQRGAAAMSGVAPLAGLMRRIAPDLVQTWMYHADLLGGLAARVSTRPPVVWGIHHTLSAADSMKPSTRRVMRVNARLSGWLPRRIVCCAESALETHARSGYHRARMRVIPNGVDTERFRPEHGARARLRAELSLPAGTKLVGMFARFHPQKDHGTLIAAFGMLLRTHPEVHLVLAGAGIDADNTALRRLLAESGCEANAHLLGARLDMPALYAALDTFTLSSSDGEALPLVIAEAMACGVPCVATDVGDTRTVIGETGVCVPARSPAALADGIRRVLDLPAEEHDRMGDAARRRILSSYDLHFAAAAYRTLYDEVIEARQPR